MFALTISFMGRLRFTFPIISYKTPLLATSYIEIYIYLFHSFEIQTQTTLLLQNQG